MLKRIICSVMLLAITAAPVYAAEIGKAAPAFSVKDINGETQSLEKYKGKIVVLEWTNPGCPFVKKHYGSTNMQKLQEYALGKGVIWLSVNSSAANKEDALDPQGAKADIAKTGAHETAYILDPEGTLGKLYGAKTTPHMFVVDASGKLAYEGAIDSKPTPDAEDIKSSDNYVKDAVDALLANKEVKVAQTRAYGCSVKYQD